MGPNVGERLLKQQEAQTAQENEKAMSRSVEGLNEELAETNRRLAEIERNNPHDELAWQHALTAVYWGLGAIGLMLIVLAVIHRIRRKTV